MKYGIDCALMHEFNRCNKLTATLIMRLHSAPSLYALCISVAMQSFDSLDQGWVRIVENDPEFVGCGVGEMV